jgi:hypothetical protein
MKMMKKLMVVFFAMAVVLSGLLLPMESKAETMLSPDEVYDDNVKGRENKNYIFVMPESGYVWIEVTPISRYYTGNDGKIEQSSSKYDKLINKIVANGKQYQWEGRYVQDGMWRSGRYNFKKGTKISIDVEGDPYYSNCIMSYKVEVKTGSEENFEVEDNSAKKNPSKLVIGESTGNFVDADVDWWVFKAPKKGTYSISGAVSDVDDEATKDKLSNAILNTTSFKGLKRSKQATLTFVDGYKNVFKGKLKKGQMVYVQVLQAQDSDVFYKLKVEKK